MSREDAQEVVRFLHDQEKELMSRWERFTQECVPAAKKFSLAEWRDHTPLLIKRLIWTADQVASGRQPHPGDDDTPQAVALTRLTQGLEFVQHFDEMTLLRLAVMQLWRETGPNRKSSESETLEEIVDYLIREVVKRYSDARESLVRALDRVAEVGLESRENLDELLQHLLDVVVQEVPGVDSAGLLLLQGEDTLQLRAAVGLEAARSRRFTLKVGEGFAGRIAAERRPMFLRDTEIATTLKSEELRSHGLRALYGVPVPDVGEPIGVLHIGSRAPDTFPRVAMHVLGAISRRVGLIVYREQAKAQLEGTARELAEREARLSAIMEAIPDGLLVYGPDARILEANDWAKQRLSHLTPETIGLSVEEQLQRWPVLDQDGQPVVPERTPVKRALRGETVIAQVLQIKAPVFGEFGLWVSISAAPIRTRSGTVVGALVTLTDVSRLRRLQEQQQILIRMVSHDLRTPLSAVSMQAEMLLRKPDAECVRRGQTIKTSAHRMDVMIKDLVDSAREETGQLKLNKQPIHLGAFVEDLRARLSGALEMDRVRVQMPQSLPTILADPDRLERILVNLISNALKYSQPSSAVIVECGLEHGGVSVAVTDSGTGIESRVLPHVFDRYFRAERTKGAEGLGLGLAITRMLVEAHGGRISVESEVGKGSVFRVWLPSEPLIDHAGEPATP